MYRSVVNKFFSKSIKFKFEWTFLFCFSKYCRIALITLSIYRYGYRYIDIHAYRQLASWFNVSCLSNVSPQSLYQQQRLAPERFQNIFGH